MKIKLLKEDEKWYRAAGRLAWNLLVAAGGILLFWYLQGIFYQTLYVGFGADINDSSWSAIRGGFILFIFFNLIPYMIVGWMVAFCINREYGIWLYLCAALALMVRMAWIIRSANENGVIFLFLVTAITMVAIAAMFSSCFVFAMWHVPDITDLSDDEDESGETAPKAQK